MYKVRKRNGKIVQFDIEKISNAIKKAFEAEDVNYDDNIIDFLALKVTAEFEHSVKDNIVNHRSVKIAFIDSCTGINNYQIKYLSSDIFI